MVDPNSLVATCSRVVLNRYNIFGELEQFERRCENMGKNDPTVVQGDKCVRVRGKDVKFMEIASKQSFTIASTRVV
jgi:hypothetical protein